MKPKALTPRTSHDPSISGPGGCRAERTRTRRHSFGRCRLARGGTGRGGRPPVPRHSVRRRCDPTALPGEGGRRHRRHRRHPAGTRRHDGAAQGPVLPATAPTWSRATLEWTNKTATEQPAWGFNWLQGQNPLKTVIRLKDGTFTDPRSRRRSCGAAGSGRRTGSTTTSRGMTFDVGRGNPGAVGLQFYSNNTGAVRDCAVVSAGRPGGGRPGPGPPRHERPAAGRGT